MTSLPDAERDARDVVQALAGLAALLRPPAVIGSAPEDESARRALIELAEDGGAAAARVLAYLRSLRGAGDGEAVAVPHRLGPWRDWVPGRGSVLGRLGPEQRIGGLPQTRRTDPGE
jgi:hypothetical protein